MTWEEIEEDLRKDEEKTKNLVSCLMDGVIHFRNSVHSQEGVLHPCTESNYRYQFTFFDQFGPVGDFRRNTLVEIAKSIREYQFQPCSVDEFQFIS